MRLAIYCDHSYRICDGHVYAEVPFSLFAREQSTQFDQVTLVGRFDPATEPFPYRMDHVAYAPLPYYASGASFRDVLVAAPSGLRRFWHVLGAVDVAWILGPNPPQAVAFALLTLLRRRRLVLGVRQDLPELIRHRYPRSRRLWVSADLLEAAFRVLGRFAGVVVVGPALARIYGSAHSLHVAYVSLLRDRDVASPEQGKRSYAGEELRMLSVGRLDPEKNPLLLADVLAAGLQRDPRWRLDVCGDGPLLESLRERLDTLGIADRARLHGHVPVHAGLLDFYRDSHALVHVSHTEGTPQVLLEAFAARLPVVATAVGGVADLVDGLGWLIPPRDASAAAQALHEVVSDDRDRRERVDRAATEVRRHTLEAETARLGEFLRSSPRARRRGAHRSARGGRRHNRDRRIPRLGVPGTLRPAREVQRRGTQRQGDPQVLRGGSRDEHVGGQHRDERQEEPT